VPENTRSGSGQVLRCIVPDIFLARLAIREAMAVGASAELWSPPDGARTLGVGFWAALDRAVTQEAGADRVTTVLDCGDAAGLVLAAFAEGLRTVHFTGRPAAATKLAAIAGDYGAVLHAGPPPPLDLRDRLDPAASCRAALKAMPDRDSRDAKTAR